MKKNPTLKVTADFTKEFNSIVKSFRHDEVLVGIPAEETERDGARGEKRMINNATLLAINNFGSPVNNIPPRPVMEIGLNNAKDAVTENFKKAALAGFSGGQNAVFKYYERAGIVAANSIKKVINDQQDIEEPSDATIAAREARGFKGEKALVVTGQMRNAITSVVRRKT